MEIIETMMNMNHINHPIINKINNFIIRMNTQINNLFQLAYHDNTETIKITKCFK